MEWYLSEIQSTRGQCLLEHLVKSKMLLLLLSCFSRVRLCAVPQMAAHQAPLSLGFSRQEYWSGLPFPSPMHVCMLSRFSRVRLCDPMDSSPRLLCPQGSLGKNTGVGCHFLLQCMTVKSESEVAQSCPAPSDSMDCSLPDSSIHGIFQARVLEWGAIAFSISHTR